MTADNADVQAPAIPAEEGEPSIGEMRSAAGGGGDKRLIARAHVALLLATIACFAPLYSVQALYPAIGARFDKDVGFAASLLTICTVGLAVFSPLAGRVSAVAGVRKAVLFAVSALMVTNLAIGQTVDAGAFMTLRLIQGCLIPIGLSALLSSLGSLWRQSGAAGLSATYTTGVIAGGLIGRFLPAALIGFGWSAAFTCFALFQLALLLVALKLIPPIDGERTITFVPLGHWLLSVWRVTIREVPAIAIGGFVLMATQAGITTFIAVRLASPPFSWSSIALGALYLVFVPAIVAVRATPAVLMRVGQTKTLAAAASASWIGLVLTLFDSEAPILLGLVIFSGSIFVAQTVFAHALSGTAEENRERASSGYLAAYYAGASMGAVAPVAAWHSWGWPGCLAAVAFIQIAGLILALRRSS